MRSEQALSTASSVDGLTKNHNNDIRLKRQLSLINGCSMIIGVIVGSGIFVSPKGVLVEAGSVGLSLLIWFLSGIYATLGALCYAELGTTIPKSGGDYAYISKAFGPLPAFLFLWMALVVINPASNAIMSITFAEYALQPFFSGCHTPVYAVKLLAACLICFLTFINCYSVRLSSTMQNGFSVVKILALFTIVAAGVFWMMLGNTENLHPSNIMEGSQFNPSRIALAFYSGVFSFSGWNTLNFVTEELINPYRNLPRAIFISLPMVTLIYMLVNLSYFSALNVPEILHSSAVAVTFAELIMGRIALIILPIFVALSCAGGLNAVTFASSRMFFSGAREGQLPEILAMINIRYLTPMPSLVILGILSLLMLIPSDIFLLINYVTFTETLVIVLSIAGLIKLRITQPNIQRPIKYHIALPITFLSICTCLLVLPFFTQTYEMVIGAAIVCSGIPFYLIFVLWESKPKLLYNPWISFTHTVQKFFLCVPEEEHID